LEGSIFSFIELLGYTLIIKNGLIIIVLD
jgi:hypothetical protein